MMSCIFSKSPSLLKLGFICTYTVQRVMRVSNATAAGRAGPLSARTLVPGKSFLRSMTWQSSVKSSVLAPGMAIDSAAALEMMSRLLRRMISSRRPCKRAMRGAVHESLALKLRLSCHGGESIRSAGATSHRRAIHTFCLGVRSPWRKTVTLALSVQLDCSESRSAPAPALPSVMVRLGTLVLQNLLKISAHLSDKEIEGE